MKTTKSIAAILFVLLAAQIASAYYCPSTGCWLSRDPIGEPGFEYLRIASALPVVGRATPSQPNRWIRRNAVAESKEPNRYSFVANAPTWAIDHLGLATISVGKCEIVVAYGHGITGSPHKFDWDGPCTAGWFIGCYSSETDDNLGKLHGIPGAVSRSGEYDLSTDWQAFDNDFETSWQAALTKAQSMCKLCKCLCPSITVKAVQVKIGDWTKDSIVPDESKGHPDVKISCSEKKEP